MEDYSSKTFKVYTFSEKELSDEFKIKKEEKWKSTQRIKSAEMLRINGLKYDIYSTYVEFKD